jgi:uncharacterized protein YdaU (DUF1376 family)
MASGYEPKYVMWHEKDFAADTYVSRVMRPLDRHFYRALIIASSYNSERPFLPNDDTQLWILADAESLDQWMSHKDVVMHKFALTEDGKHWQHKRILADWQLMIDAHQKYVERGRKGGLKGGKGRPIHHPACSSCGEEHSRDWTCEHYAQFIAAGTGS